MKTISHQIITGTTLRRKCQFNPIPACIPLAISDQLYFLRLSKVWSMLHHGSVGRVQIKNATLSVLSSDICYAFFSYFFSFHHEICVFIIFISFFDEVANFQNRILTSQKQKLVIRIFQSNFVTVSPKCGNSLCTIIHDLNIRL